jgi:formylglycine-generating enzyme required for sulfatase activity
MQPEERDAAYLWDMLQASRDILEFTRGVSQGEYSSNKMLQMAVAKPREARNKPGEFCSRLREARSKPRGVWQPVPDRAMTRAEGSDKITRTLRGDPGGPMANFTTVFLSSTAKDLQPCRNAVVEAIHQMSGFHCVRMEDFGAAGVVPVDLCRCKVAESDVFVGLVGHFHGSCPKGSDLSYTQIEYDKAKRTGKPCLMFVADDDFPLSPPLGRETEKAYKRQLRFRKQVGDENTVVSFHDPQKLATQVATALQTHQAEQAPKSGGKAGQGAKNASGRGLADLAQTETLYRAHLVERHRYLDFRGMGISDRVPLRLPLLDMYVPLKARVQTPDGDTWARQTRLAGRLVGDDEVEAMDERLSEPRPVLDLLQKSSGLILLGDPGSGKTTVLKSLALVLASGQEEIPGLGRRLPVLVQLSAYANAIAKRGLPLQDFLPLYFKDRGLEAPVADLLAERLARGEVLVLLDGLDEVRELKHRHRVVERVQDFYSRHREAGNKFVLASRVVGYREVRPAAEGLAEATLVDFEDEEIEAFVGKWTAAIEAAATGETRIAQEEVNRERQELLTAVRTNPGVRSLAAKPLLLTILALMKRQGVTLPERRVELYQRYVETLIKHWNLARGSAKDLDLLDTLRVLQPLALWMHESSPGEGLVNEGHLHRELQRIFAERKKRDPEKAAHQFLVDVREHTGLLLYRGGRKYGFIHLTFQEYLAAASIAQRGPQEVEPIVLALASHVGEAPWREVSLLTLGHLGLVQQRDQAAGKVLGELLQRSPGPAGEAAILAGEALVDMGRDVIASECCERIVGALVTTMRDDRQVKAIRRAAAGKALAVLGDPRFDPELWWLPKEPDLGFVEVPAGEFLMGSDPEEPEYLESEYRRHSVTLPGFWLGRHPVTVGQYQAFVEASGYRPKDLRWERDLSPQPVVYVSWYDALAYCQWLGERLRDLVSGTGREAGSPSLWSGLASGKLRASLPSEAEWEKAARGTEGLIYPWGQEADTNRANYHDTRLGEKSVVGCFPGGASPYGIEELSGNIWEWTRSLYQDYPYAPVAAREDLKASSNVIRVMRGGTFFNGSRFVRCACRREGSPDARRVRYVGFRVVLGPDAAYGSTGTNSASVSSTSSRWNPRRGPTRTNPS